MEDFGWDWKEEKGVKGSDKSFSSSRGKQKWLGVRLEVC